MDNQNSYQQIDLAEIYGLNNCNGHGCEFQNELNPYIQKPSLEQIASYVDEERTNTPAQPSVSKSVQSKQNQIPTQGDLSQMYQPITQQQAELYPTPAIVAAENAESDYQSEEKTVTESSDQSISDMITDFSNPYPVTRESIQYLNGFIRTQIGRRVTIDFLIGSNTIESKSGYLLAVAANYILLNELDTNDVTACDFYNIKFIRFYY